MKSKSKNKVEFDTYSPWNNCHIDVWFTIAKYLKPEDTQNFALICKKTNAVVNLEAFWNGIFNRFIRSKYSWLDRPEISFGSSEFEWEFQNFFLKKSKFHPDTRDETIRELFRSCPPFCNRKPDPDSYDKVTNKTCIRITHIFDEELEIRSYLFKVQSRFTNFSHLASQNQHEGCQILVVRTKHFVPVPFEMENLMIKSISKNLSKGFRAYKLKIEFCDQFGNRAGETLVFDPIVDLQLHNWWDEGYSTLVNNKC